MNPNIKYKANKLSENQNKQSSGPLKKSKKGNPFWQNKKKAKETDDDKFEEVKPGSIPSFQPNNEDSSDEEEDGHQTASNYDSLVRDQNKKHKKSGGFQSMGLNPNVFKGVERKGYKQPTPIQRRCIPILLEGRDCVAMARTGSGKTAAFLIPMFNRLKMRSAKSGFRGLILAPTRELALQTLKFTKELGRFVGLQAVVILGGEKIEDQFAAIHSNPDVIIATPGRFLHVVLEMDLNLSSVEYVVFDEADRLFELGFSDQMQQILERLPDTHRQTLLFSATLPKLLVDFAKAGLKDPTLIRLDVETKLSENLKMAFLYTRAEDKMATLLHLLRRVIPSTQQTLIFAATKHHVELLRETLTIAGFPCAFCYSSLDQAARKIEVAKFRLKKAMVMVVTDVAARGIDIPLLDNVVNFHFPPKAKVYVHRVGRVARAGSSGVSYSLVASDEFAYMMDLHLFLGRPLQFVTSQSTSENDGLIGGVPQHLIDEEDDIYKRIATDSSEVENLENVSTNAYKMYLRSRPVASTESSKRLKELNLATATILPHPMIIAGEDGDKKAAQDLTVMLSEMKRFRPQATIFEVNKSKKAEGLEVMKNKRQTHDGFLAKKRQKLEDDAASKSAEGEPEDSTTTATTSDPSESASDAAIDAAFGSNVIAPKNRSDAYFNKLNADMAKKASKMQKRGADFKDADHYVPDRASDYHTEKGLEVSSNSFETEARGATMDLTMDDNDTMRMQKQRNDATKKRWDRKKMKFVGQNEKQVKSGKKIKNEAGQWITASYKTDRYKKWKKASKVDSAAVEGEEEAGDEGGRGPPPRGPMNVNPAMGFRKRWHTDHAQEKMKVRDGILSKEKILKTRMKKDAKKSYQMYRQKINKKRK